MFVNALSLLLAIVLIWKYNITLTRTLDFVVADITSRNVQEWGYQTG